MFILSSIDFTSVLEWLEVTKKVVLSKSNNDRCNDSLFRKESINVPQADHQVRAVVENSISVHRRACIKHAYV